MIDGNQLGNVAICNIVNILDSFKELIAVFHYHQLVVAHETFLLILNGGTYTGIVPVRPLVRTAKDNGFVLAIFVVRICQCFNKFPSGKPQDVIEPVRLQFERFHRKDIAPGLIILGDHCP